MKWYERKKIKYSMWIITALLAWFVNPVYSFALVIAWISAPFTIYSFKLIVFPLISTILYFYLSKYNMSLPLKSTKYYVLLLCRIIIIITSFLYGFTLAV